MITCLHFTDIYALVWLINSRGFTYKELLSPSAPEGLLVIAGNVRSKSSLEKGMVLSLLRFPLAPPSLVWQTQCPFGMMHWHRILSGGPHLMEGSLCHLCCLILMSEFCCEHVKLNISWKELVAYQKRQEDVENSRISIIILTWWSMFVCMWQNFVWDLLSFKHCPSD